MTSISTEAPTCVRLGISLSTRTTHLHPSFSGKQFGVADGILSSLKNLKVTLDIDSQVKIDECKLSSSMSQHKVIPYRSHCSGLQAIQCDCHCELATHVALRFKLTENNAVDGLNHSLLDGCHRPADCSSPCERRKSHL